ncbi:MAG TPA: hypothetical protein VJN18_10065 [Polyangiaceae bacterium]|nr:hypothetical protein [Polyangiaceae bacterium]
MDQRARLEAEERVTRIAPPVLYDTLGDEVMNTTKQRVKYRIHLPEEAIKVLRWHVETQLETAEMRESELLFPAITGGYRSPSVLNKPFEEVSRAIGLRQRFTQRGLRRTFNDLARAAQVEGVVTKSISGHVTDRMRERYSTVAPIEQRASIARVIDFAQARSTLASLASQGSEPATSGEQTGEQAPQSGEQKENAG